jgi:hypothetical protein
MDLPEEAEPISALQARLRTRHDQLHAAGAGRWPEQLVIATLNDTVALLNAQAREAAQAAEQQRAANSRKIRTAAQAAAAVLAVESAAGVTGLIPAGWLIMTIPMLLGALIIWGAETSRSPQGQGYRLASAVLLGVAAVWTGVVAMIHVGVDWGIPAVALAVIAGFAWPHTPQPATGQEKEAPEWR